MYTLLHCNIFSLKCPTTHWNRAPKFKSAFFTDSNLWKLSIGFVLRLYHISFNVNLASQATKPFPQSCGAKYFSQQSPFIFLAQKSLYCVTRAPLLYFIRSWVALSFKVVSLSGIGNTCPDLHFLQYIKAWMSSTDPVSSITNCYRLIVSYTDPVHSFIIS